MLGHVLPRTVASSPSGWAIRCMAVAAIAIGISTSMPSMLVFEHRFDTSISTRGRMRSLQNAMFGQFEYTRKKLLPFEWQK